MRVVTSVLLILGAMHLPVAPAQSQSEQLTEKEKARIREQVKSLKDSKVKDAESANKSVKQAALKQGEIVDQKVNQASQQIDKAVENFSPRFGVERTQALGDQRKQELKNLGNSEKEKIAKAARQRGATNASAAKKTADGVDATIDGLKSQVSKDGKYGLKPKGSSLYVRNYGEKSEKK